MDYFKRIDESKASRVKITSSIMRNLYSDAIDNPKYFAMPYKTGDDKLQPLANNLVRLLLERHFDIPNIRVRFISTFTHSFGYKIEICGIEGTINGFSFNIEFHMRQYREGDAGEFSNFRVNNFELRNSYFDGYDPSVYVYNQSSGSGFRSLQSTLKTYREESSRYCTTRYLSSPETISSIDFISCVLTGKPSPIGSFERLTKEQLESVISNPDILKETFSEEKIGEGAYGVGPIVVEFLVSDAYDLLGPYFNQIIEYVKSFPCKEGLPDFSVIELNNVY